MRIRERMSLEAGREIAEIGLRLLDDAYMAWEAAELEAEHALRAWSEGRERAAAYQAYRAALDREEAAARDLERLHAVCEEAFVAAE